MTDEERNIRIELCGESNTARTAGELCALLEKYPKDTLILRNHDETAAYYLVSFTADETVGSVMIRDHDTIKYFGESKIADTVLIF
jgi:hypothetical protein